MNISTTISSTLLGLITAFLCLQRKTNYSYGYNTKWEGIYKKYALGYENPFILILYPIMFYLSVYLLVAIIKIIKEPVPEKTVCKIDTNKET